MYLQSRQRTAISSSRNQDRNSIEKKKLIPPTALKGTECNVLSPRFTVHCCDEILNRFQRSEMGPAHQSQIIATSTTNRTSQSRMEDYYYYYQYRFVESITSYRTGRKKMFQSCELNLCSWLPSLLRTMTIVLESLHCSNYVVMSNNNII